MRIKPVLWLAPCFAAAFGLLRVFVIVLAAVTLHEMTHVIVGLIFHVRVTKVIITPLGETAVLKGLDQKNPWVRGAVILAGPAINLIIGFLGLKLFGITDITMPEKGFGLGYFFSTNIALGLFNLLPAFPLDGGRLCQLILGNTIGVTRANRIVCRISRVCAILMIPIGIIQMILFSYNMSLYLVGIYIIKNLPKEQLRLSFEFFSYFGSNRRNRHKDIPIKYFAITPSVPLTYLIDCLRWDVFSVFNIYSNNGMVNSFSEKDLLRYIRNNGLTGRASDIEFY